MQLLAIAVSAAVVVGGGLFVWAPWDDGFDWEGLTCAGTPTPFEKPLTGRILFYLENAGLSTVGTLCIYDDERVLRWSEEAEMAAGETFVLEVPVPREALASKAEFGRVDGGSASSGRYQDIADCTDGRGVHAGQFRFTESSAGSGSGDGYGPESNCDLPWTSWFDHGAPDAGETAQTANLGGANAPAHERTEQRGWYVGFAVAGAAGGVVWIARTKFAWMLFTRLRRSELLDQKVRGQIHELIGVEPGIHASAIARTLELAQGQVHYHLSVLVRDGLLRRVGGAGRRRYFVAGAMSAQDMDRVALLRSTPVAALFDVIQRNPGDNVSVLAQRIGWSIPRVSRLLGEMERAGLIERRQNGRSVAVFPRSMPASRVGLATSA